MQTKTVVVKINTGMHARPASIFVQIASRFESEVFVEKDGQKVNGKSIMGLLMLAPVKGARLDISTTGADEEQALNALVQLVEANFEAEGFE